MTVQTDRGAEQSRSAAGRSAGSAAGSISGVSSSGTSTYFLRMLAGSRSNSSSGRIKPSTDDSPHAACHDSFSTTVDGGASTQGLPVTEAANGCCASPDITGSTCAGSCAEAAEGPVPEASGDTPQPGLQGGDWLTSMQGQLQDTEAAAAALAVAAIMPAAATPGNRSSQACIEIPAVRPAPATSEAIAAYQQQLRMLDELELLEQQVQCTAAVLAADSTAG